MPCDVTTVRKQQVLPHPACRVCSCVKSDAQLAGSFERSWQADCVMFGFSPDVDAGAFVKIQKKQSAEGYSSA